MNSVHRGGSSKFGGVFWGGSSKFGGGSFLEGVPPKFRGGLFSWGGFLQISGGSFFLGGFLQIFGGGVFFGGFLQIFGGGSPPEYGQRSAGTHPTGMHSCLYGEFLAGRALTSDWSINSLKMVAYENVFIKVQAVQLKHNYIFSHRKPF